HSVPRYADFLAYREARAGGAQGLGADTLRHGLVMRELHREGRTSLGPGPQVRGIAEHLGERYQAGDLLGVAAGLLPRDPSPAPVDVADHVAHRLLAGHHLEGHDGLEDDGG